MSLPSSDWYPELPGAKHYGRVLSPREYDGKKLGSYFPQLTPGREEVNAPGGFMIDMFDLPYIAQLPKPHALWHFGPLAARFGTDTLRGYKRGPGLTMGNALAATPPQSALGAGSALRRWAPG